ncbi:helix-turn-helix transcriptional regulator [Poseidonocella sedimentorum]|uniref:DNA binding domain-containing protein, excisionase family n=1 Tax=Poseidonocella sedimentorum TaxID=871652 RepID=A0A1I6E8P9_9RHOB|nr:helix-turn-helix transcriptional regulator [Poseidonocella sedimentorum]SFR14105.1 DNA binding domain-containing protein, excisionase family [Poseidonocella sedimentorum]
MTDAPPDPEFYTVRELAELLRVKERRVYDLADQGKIPSTRATGRLLFPRRAIRAWLAREQGGEEPRPQVFMGSHDPLLERALRDSQCGLATYFDSSEDGLRRFAAGECIAAGLHLYEPAGDQWNVPQVIQHCRDTNAALIGWAERRRGLVIRPEDIPRIKGFEDLAGRRVMRRQPEAGTESIFTFLLEDAGVDPSSFESAGIARSEQDAVMAVAEGRADACFGLMSMARIFGLGFVGLSVERFDLLVDRKAWFEDPFQMFLAHCLTDAFKAQMEAATGYDMDPLGLVRWNA